MKFAITRMLKAKSKYRVRDFVNLCHRMPHVADAMSRLLSARFKPRSLESWFLEQANGDWWLFDWSVGHYLRIFPTDFAPGNELLEWTSERVSDGTCSVQLLAACAQRLSVWDPEKTRNAVRSGLGRSNNPHHRRILALAALNAGEASRQVGRWLSQETENRVTLEMLRATSFASPRVSRAYAGTRR